MVRRAMPVAPVCLDGALDMHLDWPTLEFENALGPGAEAVPEFQSDAFRRPGPTAVQAEAAVVTESTVTRSRAALVLIGSPAVSSLGCLANPARRPPTSRVCSL